MSISVIIPVYNTPVEAFGSCVSSVLALKQLGELIIVDDGSREELARAYRETIDRLDNGKIKLVRQKNGGVSSARNAGIELAAGEYIMFVDSDDALIAEGVSDDYEDAQLIIYDSVMKKGRNQQIKKTGLKAEPGIVSHENLIWNAILNGKLGFIHGIVYQREFLQQNHLRFNPNSIQQEDAEFNFEVLNAKPRARYINRAVYSYHYSAQTALNRWAKAPEKMIGGGAARFERRMAYVEKTEILDSAETKKLLVTRRIHALYQNGIDLCCAGQATPENREKIETLMRRIALPEDGDSKTRKHYQAIAGRKWLGISLVAKARMLYLRLMGI